MEASPCRSYDEAPITSKTISLERIMYSGVSTDGARRVVLIPGHVGIQAAPRIWIPAYAGMTFHRSIHAPGGVFNMYNTLYVYVMTIPLFYCDYA